MVYRNEIKHMISPVDKASICANMSTVAQLDPHTGSEGKYLIRSLYFDNYSDKELREKIDGVNEREKFRICAFTWNGWCAFYCSFPYSD